jgi:hypothetical protein
MKNLILVTALATVLPLIGTTNLVAEELATEQQMSLEPEALARLFPGHYEALVAGGYKLMIAAREDGPKMGRAFGRQDEGAWKVADNQLCVAWRSWTRGEFQCGSIVQHGEWFVATNERSGDTMKFKPVNKAEVYNVRVGRRVARD